MYVAFGRPTRIAAFACAALSLALPGMAGAQTRISDGTVLITQSGAAASGIGATDSAGFPITITKSGSYRLTENLVVPAGLDAIQVADGVDALIDMGGFNIVGPAVCSQSANCITEGSGTAGIRTMGSSAKVTVSNGRIRGFSLAGIAGSGSYYYGSATVDNVRLMNNGYGIRIGALTATRVTAAQNSGTGIVASAAQIADSRAESNGTHGIYLSNGIVRDTMALSNKGYGFAVPENMAYVNVLWHHNFAMYNATGSSNRPGPLASTNAF